MDMCFHESDDGSAFKLGELKALVRITFEHRLMSRRREAEIEGVIQQSKSADTLGPYGPYRILGPMRCVIQDEERPACREMETFVDNNADDDDIANMHNHSKKDDMLPAIHSITTSCCCHFRLCFGRS